MCVCVYPQHHYIPHNTGISPLDLGQGSWEDIAFAWRRTAAFLLRRAGNLGPILAMPRVANPALTGTPWTPKKREREYLDYLLIASGNLE